MADQRGFVLETSLSGVALGFFEDGQRLDWQYLSEDNAKVCGILPQVFKEGLSALRWRIEDIGLAVVSRGPGSFTGIRVGLSFVYGLLAARPSLRCLGVSGLGAFLESQESFTNILWENTKTHAYRGSRAQGGHFVFDLLSPNQIGSVVSSIYCEEQPSVKVFLSSAGTHLCLPATTIKQNVMDAMVAKAIEIVRHGSNNSCLEPEYVRLSTAEERFIRS